MVMLEATGLVKTYGRRRVVDGVAFQVEQGEIVGLLGPNGAGKTTSFRMTCGLVEPDAGRVMLNQSDVTNLPMYQRAQQGMGYLAQESSVFRKLTVENNLLGVVEMLGMDRKQRKARDEGRRHRNVLSDLLLRKSLATTDARARLARPPSLPSSPRAPWR